MNIKPTAFFVDRLKQKNKTLSALTKATKSFPELRIGQILGSLLYRDLYYINDSELEAALYRYIRTYK